MRPPLFFALAIAIAVSGGAAAAASDEDVPAAEAAAFMKGLDAVTGTPRDEQQRLVAEACAELTHCAASCAKPLSAYANGKPAALLDCAEFVTVARGATGDTLAAKASEWTRARITAYAARARRSIVPAKQRRYDDLCARLGLAALKN